MTTTSVPQRPDPTRTGAVWVTGTGAFLLLAAAAVFTAVRWEQIPPQAKLAALGLATGGFLLAGRRLARSLPATAAALFHLGTFLVPIDVAAIGVRSGWTWPTLLLAQGIAATVTFTWASRVEGSVVLRWAAGGAVVVLAGGLGATTPVPAAAFLAAAAAAAVARREHGPAVAWAAVVALAPLATQIQRGLVTGAGVLDDLGLAPGHLPLVSALAAVAAGGTIGVVAHRRDQLDLALVGVVAALTGVAGSWFGTDPSSGSTAVALAATFVGAELVALALRDDRFWSSPGRLVAQVAEVGAGFAAAPLLGIALVGWGFDETEPTLGFAAALLAAGWVLADRRRGDAGLPFTTVAVSSSAAFAVALATTEPAALAATLGTVAVAAALADRRDGIPVAVTAASLAPLVGWSTPILSVALGVVGAVTIGETAVRRSRRADGQEASAALALVSLLPLATAVFGLDHELGSTPGTLVAAALGMWALAAWIDRGEAITDGLPLGTMVRGCLALILAGTSELRPAEVAVVAGVATVLSVADAIRLRLPQLAYGAALSLPVAVGTFVHSTGLSAPATGVALTVAAVVVAGLGSLLDDGWRGPCAATIAVFLVAGVAIAAPEPDAFAHAVLVSGALGVAIGTVLGRTDLQSAGGLVATLGYWLRLGSAGIHAPEAYLLPVVAVLVVAGTRAMANGTASSWVAYGPAIGLLGGTALSERFDGGPGWHAVVAGAVGVVAVAIGGDRRLAGPLVLGTALLVALVGYESLAITAGLPTWTWLAAGGAVLLGAGVAMERHEVGPLETGRRLVDVVAERYR